MKRPAINLKGEELSRLDEALRKEWLLTNGLGGYASSTVIGVNTRKYHGLLVAALHPPRDRTVCLSKLDEECTINRDVYLLGANEFQEAVFPAGFKHLKELSVSPFPRFAYSVPGAEIQKTIFMPYGKNAAVAVYNVQNGGRDVKIRIYPLLTCRHIHSVIDKYTNPPGFYQEQDSQREVQIVFKAPKTAAITIRTTSGEFHENPNWIERLRYRQDEMREESSREDCYQPGYFEITIPAEGREKFALITSADEERQQSVEILGTIGSTMPDVELAFRGEMERQNNVLVSFYRSHVGAPESDWLSWILLAADAFIVNSENHRKNVIAGYHWYEAWGRDTFISVPGLMLVTGKFGDARGVFSDFGARCRQGLIPNFLNDKSGEAAYNTVDSTLWFVNAVLQYLKYTGDFCFVHNELWETLKDILENHIRGTAFDIRLAADGLLEHGKRLTWMDAEVNGKVITPRAGKAVEIQALWYNALRIMQFLADRFKEKSLAETYVKLADKAKDNFGEKFWNSGKRCLFDVVAEQGIDASLRPNQIIAVSLDFTMLNQSHNESIVEVVQRELLTSCGLRTLARNDPEYRGIYFGDRLNRDSAYHNGTVWPWLLGPFITAFLKTKGFAAPNREYALKSFLLPLFTQQTYEAGLGTISEIFDGDEPHMPKGCVAQAWSVAEPLRAYVEDVMQVRPVHAREVTQA